MIMVSDAYEQLRTKTLFYTQSTSQIVQFLAPALTSATMTKSLWIPLAMGLSCGILVFPLIALIPDTRPVTAQVGPLARTFSAHELIPTLTEPLLQDEADFDATAVPADAENDHKLDKPSETVMASIRRERQILWEQLYDMRRLVTSSKNYGLCLAVFLGSTLARSSFYNLLQYASKRYHLSFAVVRMFDLGCLSRVLILDTYRLGILCRSTPQSISSCLYSSFRDSSTS
jgi:hypothetical protein